MNLYIIFYHKRFDMVSLLVLQKRFHTTNQISSCQFYLTGYSIFRDIRALRSEENRLWLLPMCRSQGHRKWKLLITRMHSSRMRTGRALTVSRGGMTSSPPKNQAPPTPRKIRHPPKNTPPKNTPPEKSGTTPLKNQAPPLWTEWQTGVKILPWPKLRFGR